MRHEDQEGAMNGARGTGGRDIVSGGSPRDGDGCPECNRRFGGGISCQFCDYVEGMPSGVRLASAGKRFGGYLLEGILVFVTLGIGWVIWALIVHAYGQTPAKQVLGMRVVKLREQRSAGWGITFLREWILKGVIGFITLGIGFIWLIWDGDNQNLYDKVAGTLVVDDPRKAVAS